MSGPDDASAIRWEEAEAWFVHARRDIAVAHLALGAGPALVEPAGFHCQQAVEKFLKGLLVSSGTVPPRTHDLGRLFALATRDHAAIVTAFGDLASLTSWSVEGRYPDMPGGDDVTPALVARVLVRLAAMDAAIHGLKPPG